MQCHNPTAFSSETQKRRRAALKKRQTFISIAKLTVTVILLVYLLSKVDCEEMVAILRGVNAIYILAVLVLAMSVNLIYSHMWQIVLAAQNIKVPLVKLLALYYIGLFFNNFMPSVIGGDVVRIYQLSKHTQKAIDSSLSVIITRLVSICALLLIIAAALISTGWGMEVPNIVKVLIISFLVGIVLLPLWGSRLLIYLNEVSLIKESPRVSSILEHVCMSISLLKTHKLTILLSLVHALICHILSVFANYLLSLSLGFSVSFYYFLLFMPLISLIIMFPISINGFGLREGVFVLLFNQVGLSTSAAISLSLIGRLNTLLSSLLGGMAYVLTGRIETSTATQRE